MNRIAVLSRPSVGSSLGSTSPPTAAVEGGSAVSTTGASLSEPTPVIGVGFLLAWVTIGLLTAAVLRRRGHDFRSAAALGFVFGPLFIPLALRTLRDGQEDAEPVLIRPGDPGRGPVDVLIGLDGPTSSAASVIPILRVLDQRLGRLALARVLDFESVRDEEKLARAGLTLSCASLFLGHHQPSIVLVPGHGRRALVEHAVAAGYDLVVIVTSSRRALLSRPLRELQASVDVPVLLMADAAPRGR